MDIKTIQVTGDNLSDIVFTLEVSENYFQKYDEIKDVHTGLEFVVIDRPYRTVRGNWEIRCKLLTKAKYLRFVKYDYLDEFYNNSEKINKDERTEVWI